MSRGIVVVAMSGGVDSSVAAALLQEKGYEVIGATLKLWCYGETAPSGRTCCSLEDIADARAVAARLGIRHVVLDMQGDFDRQVIAPFVLAYLNGETPNPCVECNTHLKFGQLVDFADQVGAEYLATGHHARRGTGPDGEPAVFRAADRAKDQSYVLWGVAPTVLARVLLPVGELTKADVRAVADRIQLEVARKPDSQDICFVQAGHYADFVRARAQDRIHPGPIVDRDGKVIGRHQGLVDFTVGQRRGLGLGGGRDRSYVIGLDPASNTVQIGEQADLGTQAVRLRNVNWHRARPPVLGEDLELQVRSSSLPGRARVRHAGRELVLDLPLPTYGAVAGQSGVLYEGERVAGGGIIERGARRAEDLPVTAHAGLV
jgi:tRNA-specific 2-thiouridylase